jgi:membrane-associated protease RseP (regulator of RpoE activity)
MSSPHSAREISRRVSSFAARHWRRLREDNLSSPARRLAHFWVVWSALLLIHEGGHALAARQQGLPVARLTVGVGPVLWRGQAGDTRLVLRTLPLAGVTTIGRANARATSTGASERGGSVGALSRELATIGGGILATLVIAIVVAAVVMAREHATGRRWVWGRFIVADAVVITLFNFLPIPPLDGGRALLGLFGAWRGAPLAGDALFWLQIVGLTLAVLPMTLWTRWTARIDAVAMRWRIPASA